MKIMTANFGELEVPEGQVIAFPKGLIGFEDLKKFFFIDADKDSSFLWMQCVDDPKVAFLVIEPVSFMFNYALNLPDDVVAEIGVERPEDVLICALVTVPEDPARISANLCGPLVVNKRNRQGRQVVSQDPNHLVKHFILEELQKNAERLRTETKPAEGDAPAPPQGEVVRNAGSHPKN